MANTPRTWLILSHAFNMDGRAASQTITDKIPRLRERGINPVVISAITGRKDPNQPGASQPPPRVQTLQNGAVGIAAHPPSSTYNASLHLVSTCATATVVTLASSVDARNAIGDRQATADSYVATDWSTALHDAGCTA